MSVDPREVFDRLIKGVTNHRWEELPDLYADDALVEHPFNIPQASRLCGREELRRHFAGAAQGPLRLRAANVVVHRTTDPEVIIGEFDYMGSVTTTGREFTVHNICVIRVRDGRIVESRDYHNHFALAEAMRG